ncbi:hypothetical protein H4R20_004827 [Coemansia guatemalensis]|uniref:Protein YAE1 n=1 Tax=Coemansia guatemalensis TaxID=2761395 RepID=A0A9W8LRQ4_9FUNG|nr:hypothetical protein H4R20_004827 [Coemansia guatemalensis]
MDQARPTKEIDDDVWDLAQDDLSNERAVASQSLAKLERAFANAGYKEGIDASKAEVMQEGFDQGLTLAIGHGQTLGSLLGALVAHRTICRKLDKTSPISNIDALIMKLRAFKHSSAFDLTKASLLQEGSADALDPTADAFKKLVAEALDALHMLAYH